MLQKTLIVNTQEYFSQYVGVKSFLNMLVNSPLFLSLG